MYIVNDKNKVIACLENACRILRHEAPFKGLFYHDRFTDRIMYRRREWTDADASALTARIQEQLGMPQMATKLISEAVLVVAMENQIDSAVEWVSSLQWDGKDRINTALINWFGLADTEYTRAVSRNFWLSLLARITRPGAKVDNMIILEGSQGLRKSSALETIAGPDWYAELGDGFGTKDFLLAMQGKIIIEVAELDAFSKAGVNQIKRTLSCRTDRYRAPYGKLPDDHPRRCIFAGTTNEQAYLCDNTGGRRFWPVECTKCDIGLIRDEREQCFAEAHDLILKNNPWWLMPAEETAAEQEYRREADTWEGILCSYLMNREDPHTVTALMNDVLDIPAAQQTRQDQRRVAACLRSIGWKPCRMNKNARLWVRK